MPREPLSWQQHLLRVAYAAGVAIAVSLYNNLETPPTRPPFSTPALQVGRDFFSHSAEKILRQRKIHAHSCLSPVTELKRLKARGNLL